ncbi:uncharacterized protein LOC133788674 isoform X2 [Humulus lupulus]|nr:uncharacterized protein LOC133788674 isoform X2 [Humulus lupulus]
MDPPLSDDDVDPFGDDNDEMGEIPQEVKISKIYRGKTVCADVIKARSEGRKLVVEYNQLGISIGKGATKMASRIGVFARCHIPLNIDDWRLVPNETKELIWKEINESFDVQATSKAKVLSEVGDRWRDWKSWLTKNKVEKYKEKAPELLAHPPDAWSNWIKQDDWEGFVAKRLSPQWAELRKEKQGARAQNKYNHRTGRGGYKQIEQQLEAELGHELTDFDRADMWLRIRKDKKGESTEDVASIKEKIVDYKQKVAKGTLVVEGSKDVLTLALGTPEHSGRVRGMPKGVTPTQFFKTPKPKRKS